MQVKPGHHKRLKRVEDGGPRFITFSCHERRQLLANPAIRDHFVRVLADAREQHGFRLYAWVVMPEHAHILVQPAPGAKLSPALLTVKLTFARNVIDRWIELDAPILRDITLEDGRRRFWLKGGGFDRNVRDASEFGKDVRYVHENPVERGLAHLASDWRWSSVRWWLGRRQGELPCDPPPHYGFDWSTWRGFAAEA